MTARTSLAVALVCLAGRGAAAPPDPLELARGLRATGSGDLALEYLAELAKSNPPPEVLAVLPLERAQARLDLATAEADPAARAALGAGARADFELFLKTATGHPRRGEAAAALARLVSTAARASALAANERGDPQARATALRAARAEFADAAARYKEAAEAVERAAARDQGRAAGVAREVRLAEALNQFQLAKTYDGASGASELLERGKAYAAAQKLFAAIGKGDPAQPASSVARAWAAECTRLMGDPRAAAEAFALLRKAPRESPGAAGARQAEFFQARAAYEDALTAGDRDGALRKAQAGLEAWLAAAPPRAAPTPELVAARYFVAYAQFAQALLLVTRTKAGSVEVPASARGLLVQAERDFRRAAEPGGEYAARAAEFRDQAARLLIGDPDRLDPATMTDPEAIALAARVQLARASQATEAERRALAERAVAFFERSRRSPPVGRTGREASDAALARVYALLLAGRPAEAAVVGEHLARTGRAPAAPRAGLYALQAYLRAAPPASDPAATRVDAARFVALATYLDATFAADDSADEARLFAARHLLTLGRPAEAAALAANVAPTSPRAGGARLLQALAVTKLFDPAAAKPDPGRLAALDRAIAAVTALPAPAKSAGEDESRLELLARLQLTELRLLKSPPDLPGAAASAADAEARVGNSRLPEAGKRELTLRAESARARVGYAQALTAYQAKDYPRAAEKLAPLLAQADRGPAARAGDPPATAAVARQLDDLRRTRLVALALQVRLAGGQVGEVAPVLATLAKLGGSLGDSPEALAALVDSVRPQLDALRREGKAGEADRVAGAIQGVLGGVADAPGASAATLLSVARGLRELGAPERALAAARKVPAPVPAAPPSKEQSAAAARYRLAQLEAVRCLRDARRFDEADAAIQQGLTLPGANDFRKEAAYVVEARAAAAGPGEKQKLWGQAYKAWNDLAGSYRSPLGKILAGKSDVKSAVVALMDLKALPKHPAFARPEPELRKALAEAKPPDWLAPALGDAGTRAELTAALGRVEAILKPTYHDYLAESFRCLALANEDILGGDAAKLAPKYESLAKALVNLERQNPDLAGPVRAKLAGLVRARPALNEAYTRLGGAAFAAP